MTMTSRSDRELTPAEAQRALRWLRSQREARQRYRARQRAALDALRARAAAQGLSLEAYLESVSRRGRTS